MRQVHAARQAYDLAAPFYDQWPWQEFWHRNEWPIVSQLVAQLSCEFGGPRIVLDLGSGTGNYLGLLARDLGDCWNPIGIDLSNRMLSVARHRLDSRCSLVQADIRQLPIADQSIGIVLMNRVASHIPNLRDVVAEISRVLSPGCHLVISDVAPEHGYAATELPIANGKIVVTTIKHTITDWQTMAHEYGLECIATKILTAENAYWLPAEGFRSIDRTNHRPIAFVLGFSSSLRPNEIG